MRMFTLCLATCFLASASAMSATEPEPPTRTLGRVFEKLKAGQPTAVAYFGGSITEANGYRVLTLKWFREHFPRADVREINAAIGGTGSDLGAFRCSTDVIAHDPDLVFLEFNINDGSPTDDFHKATMEGIVRQLWSSKSHPEIVFLYTTSRNLNEKRGSHPAVAHHYGIPEIDLQPALVAALTRSDLPKPTDEQLHNPNLDWKQPGQVFMADSVHPNELGHSIYTDTIVAYLQTQIDAPAAPIPTLPAPLVSDEFARVEMALPAGATLAGNWEVQAPTSQGRYRDGTINARQPGDSLEFVFNGTGIGLFEDVQKDGGKYAWSIDEDSGEGADHPKGMVDTAPGPFFPRHHYAMLAHGLPAGRHVLRIKILPERDATSTGHRLLIGYFLVAGTSK